MDEMIEVIEERTSKLKSMEMQRAMEMIFLKVMSFHMTGAATAARLQKEAHRL